MTSPVGIVVYTCCSLLSFRVVINILQKDTHAIELPRYIDSYKDCTNIYNVLLL